MRIMEKLSSYLDRIKLPTLMIFVSMSMMLYIIFLMVRPYNIIELSPPVVLTHPVKAGSFLWFDMKYRKHEQLSALVGEQVICDSGVSLLYPASLGNLEVTEEEKVVRRYIWLPANTTGGCWLYFTARYDPSAVRTITITKKSRFYVGK